MRKTPNKLPVGEVVIGDMVVVYKLCGTVIRGKLGEIDDVGMTLENTEIYDDNILYENTGTVTVAFDDMAAYGYSRQKEAIVEKILWELTTYVPEPIKHIRIRRSKRG